MDITITETGATEELTIIDPESGVNWINDLMGNHGALPEYNDEDNTYHMIQEDFDWWDNLVKEYQTADNRYQELLNSLNGDDYDRLLAEVQDLGCDLEDYPGFLNQICDNY